jgi:VWFA-related protein
MSRWECSRLLAISLLLESLFMSAWTVLPLAYGQASDKASDASQSTIVIKATTNLVLVRVVVRDAKGNPVEGLKKEDFRLLDRGREQTISQFEESVAGPVIGATVMTSTPGQAQPEPQPDLPENFIALYIDDLDTNDANMMQVRAAADRYVAEQLHPKDRIALFTSGGMALDFTSDTKLIHDALLKLRASPRSMLRESCHLTDYEASEIIRMGGIYDPTSDVWQAAIADSAHCDQAIKPIDQSASTSSRSGSGSGKHVVPGDLPGVSIGVPPLALRVDAQARVLEQTNLDGLSFAVKATSQMPGRRTVILVSPGFLSDSVQTEVNRIIDQALRSQVVVSSLDPRGLAMLLRVADASQESIGVYSVDKRRDMTATGVLEEIAYSTGGQYFHNDNDLTAGFAALSGSPAYYTLAFSPSDLKQDGQFHLLKVTLAGEHKGVSVQARKGYFATANQPEPRVTASGASGIGSAPGTSAPSPANDPAVHEQIRAALFAKTDLSQLSVTLEAKPGEAEGDTRSLSVTSHLDGKDFPFGKDGDNSVNTVVFAFGVFDQKGNLLTVQQKHDDLVVPEGQISSFLNAGVDETVSFQLKAGSYWLREVVIEAEGHHMAAFSRTVKIP